MTRRQMVKSAGIGAAAAALRGIDAGQRCQNEQRIVGFQDIDRRLPVDCPVLRRTDVRLEDLLVQPFGLGQHLQRFRPHPVARIASVRMASCVLSCP